MADHDTAGEAYEAGGSNSFMGHDLGARGSRERTERLKGLGYAVEAVDLASSSPTRLSPQTEVTFGGLRAQALAHGVDPKDVAKHY